MKLLTPRDSSSRFAEVSRLSRSGDLELRVDVSACLDRSAATARLILTLLGGSQPWFIWIREFGIWPSLENWDLFNGLCGSSNGPGSVSETPGYEFDADEQDRFVSFVQVILLNGWGGVLVGLRSKQRIAVSHDSWISIQASDALPSQTERIEAFGLDHTRASEPSGLVEA